MPSRTKPLPISVLGHQETVQLVTQRARGTLKVQRETARRALLHRQGEFCVATNQYGVVARQNLVSALATNGEAHNLMCKLKFGSSNMKQMRDCPRYRKLIFRFLRMQIKLLKISEKFL